MPIIFPDEAKLIESINNREVCLLLGAGFTYGLKNIAGEEFKSADQLKEKIIQEYFGHWKEDDKKVFDTLDKVISEAIKENKIDNLTILLNEELTADENKFDSRYNLLKYPNWRRIYTLNADNVLDLIFKNNILPLKNYKFPNFLEFHEQSLNTETQVIYLHGKLPCNIEHELVFSFESYTRESRDNQNDLYSCFIMDLFTKPFIIVGVSFSDKDFHSYAMKEKDKLKIDFSKSVISYLIDINASEQKAIMLKRDYNITLLPKSTTIDFLNWISTKNTIKPFKPQVALSPSLHDIRYRRINLSDYNNFDLSIVRDEYIGYDNLYQELCFDILRSNHNEKVPLRQEYNLSLFSSTVNDNRVDIWAENKKQKENKIFIRCQHSIANELPTNIAREIDELLKIALPREICQNNSLWRQEKHISKYIICFSSEQPNNASLLEYKKQFKAFFKSFENNEEYKYLAEIEVVLLFWNDLKVILGDDAYLYHKWIGKEPQYLQLLNSNKVKIYSKVVNEFKDYLLDNFLPYYSRNKFKMKLSPGEQANFYDETKLINIIKERSTIGVILYGQGGIGKTRLMYELGNRFMSDKYSVIEVNKNFDDLNYLSDFINPVGKYVLLFDYIEEQKKFIEIAEWIYGNKIANIKFIANCRKSFLGDIEHLSEKKTKLIDIGTWQQSEKKYKEAIIDFIIDSISDKELKRKLKENNNIQSFLHTRPSYAVFIKYLHQKNPNSNLDLKIEDDFRKWLINRLKLTLGEADKNNKQFIKDKKNIFMLFASLRASGNSARKFKTDYFNDITALIDDGWIDEDENENLIIVHDSVSDTLLFYILNKARYDKVIIDEFLVFALRYNSLPSAIRSFERILDDEEIGDEIKLKTRNHLNEFIEQQLEAEFDPNVSYALVSYWLRRGLRPEKVKRFIVDTLEGNISPNVASIIIGHWLQNGDEPLLVKPYVKPCLDKKINPKSACYIINYWLQKGDDPNIFGKAIKRWLEIIKDPVLLAYIIKWFIKNGGDLENINDYALEWLRKNKNSNLSISIVGFWLKRLPEDIIDTKSLNLLQEYVVDVLNNYGSLEVSGSVISNWIVKGGDLAIIKPFLKNWLLKFSYNVQTEFILSWWMMKNGDPQEIKEFIVPWLKSFGTTKEASELLLTWINYSHDIDLIKDYVKDCLKANNELLELRLLITKWLELDQPSDYVKDAIGPWLNKNKGNKDSIYVVSFWLAKGDDLNLVKEYIQNSFINFTNEEDSNRIIEEWLSRGGNPNIIKESLVKYLDKFWHHNNAIYVIRHWINSTKSDDLVKEYILKINKLRKTQGLANPFERKSILLLKHFISSVLHIFKITSFDKSIRQKTVKSPYNICKQLKNGLNPDLLRKDVKEYLDSQSDNIEVSFVLRRWLEFGNDFDFVSKYIISWLTKYGLDKKHGSFIIGDCLLSSLNGFNLAEKYLNKWLDINNDSEETFFVLSSYLEGMEKFDIYSHDRFEIIGKYITPCLDKSYKNEPANHSWKRRQDILIKYSNGWAPRILE